MSDVPTIEDALGAIALLADANRLRLYELVASSTDPVGRDAAARALGISRELAAFHLDRLVKAGLLETEYRRLGDRRGPGAGRPAKLYRRVTTELAVSLPPREYERLAGRLAEALTRSDGNSGTEALLGIARSEGSDDGTAARRRAGARAGHRRRKDALLRLLDAASYEPTVDDVSGEVRLRNCPYRALATSHRELTCGMNFAWAEGVLAALDDPQLGAELAPATDRCCVVFREAQRRAPR